MAKVKWRREALEMRKSILQYGYEQFGRQTARKLRLTINRNLQLLAKNPHMGQRMPELDTQDIQVRKLQLTPIFMLIYTFNEERQQIDILTIWDNRRNPASLDQGT